ncbi:MAG: VOC family protein [Candidatus Limnocylindrales bacterium]
MFLDNQAFSGFSTDDLDKAKAFYGDTLGLDVRLNEMGALELHLATGAMVFVYPKTNHEAATDTVLNFPVGDVGAAVDRLIAAGIEMERYEGMGQDERGIMSGEGPDIAWFKDPAGNILSVLSGQS